MIIGLMGLKGSGKDTVGAYLVKQYEFERRAFADPLKQYISSVFNIPYHEIENLKNLIDCKVLIGEFVNGDQSGSIFSDQNFRSLVRNTGEAMKPILGEDVWANKTLPVAGFYTGRKIVLTDVRFRVEYDRIKELGGTIVKVHRPETEQDHHRSENEWQELDADFVIINNGGFIDLYHNIEKMIGAIGGIQGTLR